MNDLIEFVLNYCAKLPARTLKNFAGSVIYHIFRPRRRRRRY